MRFANFYRYRRIWLKGKSKFLNWNIISMKRLFVFIIILILAILTIPWGLVLKPKPSSHTKNIKAIITNNTKFDQNITIGILTCAGGYTNVGRGKNETNAMRSAAEEPLTLIKSVLISGRIWKVDHIEFYIFTDSWYLTATIARRVDEFKNILKDFLEISVHFRSVFKSVPYGHERDFIDSKRRCGYVRVFFPTFLPKSVKEILYLDTDTIIIGNIRQMWLNFRRKVVLNTNPKEPPKLAAMIQNSEVTGKYYMRIYNDNFGSIPHVPPRGLNSGVMFMNLEAMRKFNWSEVVMQLVDKWRDTLKGDQQLLNILFHNNTDRLVQFPCQYNFQHLHCEMGLSCTSLLKDPNGIQIIHGAGGIFRIRGRSHYYIFQAFKAFNLEDHKDVISHLFMPLIRFYSRTENIGNIRGRESCFGLIGKYLFNEAVVIKSN